MGAGILALIFVPKNLLTDKLISRFVLKHADLKPENVIFIDYKVYPTEAKYNAAVEDDIKTRSKLYYEEDVLLLVKENGDSSTKYNTDYISVKTPEVPKLNVEYYYLTNCNIFKNSLPIKTVVSTVKNVQDKVNVIYKIVIYSLLGAYEIVFGSLLIASIVKTTRRRKSISSITN